MSVVMLFKFGQNVLVIQESPLTRSRLMFRTPICSRADEKEISSAKGATSVAVHASRCLLLWHIQNF